MQGSQKQGKLSTWSVETLFLAWWNWIHPWEIKLFKGFARPCRGIVGVTSMKHHGPTNALRRTRPQNFKFYETMLIKALIGIHLVQSAQGIRGTSMQYKSSFPSSKLGTNEDQYNSIGAIPKSKSLASWSNVGGSKFDYLITAAASTTQLGARMCTTTKVNDWRCNKDKMQHPQSFRWDRRRNN